MWKLRKPCLFACMSCILISSLWTCAYLLANDPNQIILIPQSYQPKITLEDMRNRIQHVEALCRSNPINLSLAEIPSNMFTFENTNLCLCKVQKAGSTFWIRSLLVLNDTQNAATLTQTTGVHVHHSNVSSRRVPCNSSQDNAELKFFITRDPYDRLYSSYLDKIYMGKFGKISLGLSLIASTHKGNLSARLRYELKTGRCSSDNVTFQQFLEFVSLQFRKHRLFDGHFAPITSLCDPCKQTFDFLIRHENFRSESMAVFDHLDISDSIKMQLKSQFEEQSVSTAVHNLLHTLQNVEQARRLQGCQKTDTFMSRLWKVMQLKGYILDDLPMPKLISDIDIASADVWEVHGYIQRHFLSNEKQESQQRRHMVDAYKGIGKNTIKILQKLFSRDFFLFQYDTDPPTL